MGPTLAQVGSPACLITLPPLMQTADVDAYQAAVIAFAQLTHDALPYDFYLACLGNSLVQPRGITVRLLSRTQDETGLLRAGREAGLPLLSVHGAKDRIIVRQAVLDAVQGWKNLTVVDIEAAEHFVWLRCEFRTSFDENQHLLGLVNRTSSEAKCCRGLLACLPNVSCGHRLCVFILKSSVLHVAERLFDFLNIVFSGENL